MAFYGAITANATPAEISTPGRTTIYNNGAVNLYVGLDASVASTTGVVITPGGTGTFDPVIFVVTASANCDVRWIASG